MDHSSDSRLVESVSLRVALLLVLLNSLPDQFQRCCFVSHIFLHFNKEACSS